MKMLNTTNLLKHQKIIRENICQFPFCCDIMPDMDGIAQTDCLPALHAVGYAEKTAGQRTL